MTDNEYLSDLLKRKIKTKYGSMREYARQKGTSVQNLSNKFKVLSPMFLKELRDDGFVIDGSVNQEFSHNNNIEDTMQGNFNHSVVKEINGADPNKILTKIYDDQRTDLVHYRNLIDNTIPQITGSLNKINEELQSIKKLMEKKK